MSTTDDLRSLERLLFGLPPDVYAKVQKEVEASIEQKLWMPLPGPQTAAFESEADELFYGGSAGCGKSSLLTGTAIVGHQKAILFRREFPQIKGLIDEASRIIGTRDGYNSQDKLWKLGDGRELEFGSVQYEQDKEKYQGRAHDLKGFDEITHFTESQYRYIIGWNRTTIPGQRCRVIVTGNPPMTSEGRWVVKYWAPWLDPTHPKPAKPGELRWFTTIAGEDVEVDGPGPHMVDGKPIRARSRTFIAGKLEDNPYLMDDGNYASVLEAMPEPMRTMLREGRFDLTVEDHEWQVIPSRWVMEAQARWKVDGRNGLRMTAMGVDIAQGGSDQTVIAPRYGTWFAPLEVRKGAETPDSPSAAGLIGTIRRDGAVIIVDVGGGYGGGVVSYLKDNYIPASGFNGANESRRKTKDGTLGFYNLRAEAYWRLREDLDPGQDGGSVIALPPDPELLADLCAPLWKLTPRGIQIESKPDIKKRIGRSPDRGDAVVYSWSEGQALAEKKQKAFFTGRLPQVNTGYSRMKGR